MKFISLSVLFALATVSNARAERILTQCPKYIVDAQRGTYQRFGAALPGKRCSNNLRGLKRKGFIPEGSSTPSAPAPTPVANPVLDTERVITGRGELSVSQAFRVSNVGRVLTLQTSNCQSTGTAFMTLYHSSGWLKTISGTAGGTPVSITMFDKGTYGLGVSYNWNNACDVQIHIQ